MPTDHPSATLDYAESPPSPSAGWRAVKSNLPVPVALVAVVLLGRFVLTPGVVGAYGLELLMQVGVAVILAVSLQLINGYSGQFSLGHAGFMAVGAYLTAYPSTTLSNGLADPARVLMFYLGLGTTVGVAGTILFALFYLARLSGRLHPSLPVVLLVLIFAWVIWDVSTWAKAPAGAPPAPYLVVSNAIRLLQRLFGAIVWGAAPSAAAVSRAIPAAVRAPLCFVILLVGGGCCAAVAGLVVGLPTLRLRGDYLAIATLGFAEIIRVAIQNAEPLGGALGITMIPNYADAAWLYGAVVVTIVVVWRIAYSAKGRAIQAVREDEVAAAAVGVDTTHHKVVAFIIGAFFAGVGGALYAHNAFSITPTEFGLVRSIEFVVMVTLGGLASVSGAVLAAVVLTLLPELLRNVSPGLVEWRMVLYALLLIVMMLLRPQGLLGGREVWRRRRSILRRHRVTSPVKDQPEPETAAL